MSGSLQLSRVAQSDGSVNLYSASGHALVLGRFFGVAPADIGLYLLPFALGNFLGPLLLGRLFDTVGRRQMIALTYAASGVLLLVTAALFVAGLLTVVQQTLAWSIVFFFAPA